MASAGRQWPRCWRRNLSSQAATSSILRHRASRALLCSRTSKNGLSSTRCKNYTSHSREPETIEPLSDIEGGGELGPGSLRKKYRQFFESPAVYAEKQALTVGATISFNGFISKPRQNPTHRFFSIINDSGPDIQIRIEKGYPARDGTANYGAQKQEEDLLNKLKEIPPFSPVIATGTIHALEDGRATPATPSWKTYTGRVVVDLSEIRGLNEFPRATIVSPGVRFPPAARHLQIRFHPELRQRLLFRGFVAGDLAGAAGARGFHPLETPVLFKATSEGAREFVVPARRAGFAYALPQSPQQYKQVLMAAGMGGYQQIARCFRDEDLRADRQPEFTQFDLEKAFLDGKGMQREVESIIRQNYEAVRNGFVRQWMNDSWVPVRRETMNVAPGIHYLEYPDIEDKFPVLGYRECMDRFGVDKPDLRIEHDIYRVDAYLQQGFKKMVSHLENPVIEVWKLRLNARPHQIRGFISEFMEERASSTKDTPGDSLQALIFDSSKPLDGFSSLGPEGHSVLAQNAPTESGLRGLEEGDIVLFQARKDEPHYGGSTKLGSARAALYEAAVAKGLVSPDLSLKFLWVTEFPLFTPNNDVDPGQGGAAGFSSTHHPFTAPLAAEDFDLLLADPLRARADHFDLVLNGVELGGGSRRIHVAAVQEFVFREVLRMPEGRIGEFAHLLRALRDGCPPHAGFALGLDRYCAVLGGTASVRDVIAFPKNMHGEDVFAQSPGRIADEVLETYHLQRRKP